MQSSAMVALRTMIMIVCLIAVPLAAVFGTALPKAVKSVFGAREAWQPSQIAEDEPPPWPATRAMAAADEPRDSQSTPSEIIRPPEETPKLPTLPHARITGVRAVVDAPLAAAAADADEPMVETAPLWNPPPRTASTPRDRQMTTHFVPSPGRTDRRGESLQKTVYSPPDELELPAEPDDRLVPVVRVTNDNALADSERRLRDLGAAYYRLETWGDEGKFYRCSCSVPISPRGRTTRHFEAIEPAPSQAIEAVIKQVETWRSTRTVR